MAERPLEVVNLSFHFADVEVLENINFAIEKGDFVGLVGSNGAGKSTLIRLILGELQPVGGEVRLFGTKLPHFRQWQRIGYVSQKNADLNPAFPATVLEVVQANLYRSIGLGRPVGRKHRQLAMEALAMTGVDDLAKRRIGELSGGQQQRVFLAKALVEKPDLLILDEATTGIDERSEGLFYDLLEHLKACMGLTILMISHDMTAVTAHANRMFCLGVEGFFEHDVHEALDHNFFSKLFGYAVTPHLHEHDCAAHQGAAGLGGEGHVHGDVHSGGQGGVHV